ncbi:MAG: glycoside hydrolase family 18 protein [Alphaproteobacteria bacterium]|jgi:chitinase|nr:glycoside hydrolase family 18 protein [Alphaproteobacteria bacterium]
MKRCVLYYTSWNQDGDADFTQLSTKVTHLLLSFGRFTQETDGKFSIEASDNLLKYGFTQPEDLYWLEPEYLKWTQYKKFRDENSTSNPLKVLLAFGGATYGDMWASLDNIANVEPIAKAIVDILDVEFPVYDREGEEGEFSQVGTVKLDGVDFDYEQDGRPSTTQMNNLGLLINRIKEAKPDAVVSLTGYHVSADPESCSITAGPDCSFVGSSHCGELLPLLMNIKLLAKLDFYNLMAYDAGRDYPWKIAMANHAKYLPDEKVTLGLTLGLQWDPEANFVEDMAELQNRIKEEATLPYGGIMVWAMKADDGSWTTGNEMIAKINELLSVFNN